MKRKMIVLFTFLSVSVIFSNTKAEQCVTSTSGRVTGECFTSQAGGKKCIQGTPVDCAGVIIVHELD